MINEVGQKTLEELKKKDDKWLLSMDTKWSVNTYWKWFHVCEHESNHRGQITWLKRRLPELSLVMINLQESLSCLSVLLVL